MDPKSYELDRALTYRLHRLHKLTDLDSQRSYPAATGLTLSEGRCLSTIGAFGPLSINDLARVSNLNKGQASRAAQALVEKDLVNKKTTTDDARGVSLSLTSAGIRIWNKTIAMIEQRNMEIFGCLNQKEQQQFSALLDRLINHALENSSKVKHSNTFINE